MADSPRMQRGDARYPDAPFCLLPHAFCLLLT